MRGKYHMPEWEIEKWKEKLTYGIQAVDEFYLDEYNLTDYNICPANVKEILTEHMGYEEISYDENGWEHDTWYTFKHPETKKRITMFYCGYTFELTLLPCEEPVGEEDE